MQQLLVKKKSEVIKKELSLTSRAALTQGPPTSHMVCLGLVILALTLEH